MTTFSGRDSATILLVTNSCRDLSNFAEELLESVHTSERKYSLAPYLLKTSLASGWAWF